MTKQQRKPVRKDTYAYYTHRPVNSLAIVLPLLVIFHAGTYFYHTALIAPLYIGHVLEYFGATASFFLPPLLVTAVLLAQQAFHHDPWKIQPGVVAGMLAEAILWTIPLIALSYLTSRINISAGSWLTPDGQRMAQSVLTCLGAGLYEEFLFRMVLISVSLLIFVDVLGLRKDIVAVTAIIGGAILFSLCHFNAAQLTGEAVFPAARFIFLAVAGVLWGCLYAYRGFAVAVGSHIVWDLFVVFVRN